MRDVQSGYEQCAIEYQSHIADQQAPTSSDQNDAVEHSNRLCWSVVDSIVSFVILFVAIYIDCFCVANSFLGSAYGVPFPSQFYDFFLIYLPSIQLKAK